MARCEPSLSGSHQVGSKGAERRSQSKKDSRYYGYHKREGQNFAIDAHARGPKDVAKGIGGCGTHHCGRTPISKDQANVSARDRQHHTFRQQLADDAPAGGPHRCSNHHFPFARSGSRQ